MKIGRSFVLGLALATLAAAAPAAAQLAPLITEVEPVLVRIGQSLLTGLASGAAQAAAGKLVDHVIDSVTGKNADRELHDVETRLQRQLTQSTADHEKVKHLLAVTQKQEKVLHRLMAGLPSAEQMAHDKSTIAADLHSLEKIVAEHEKRLAEHDRRLDDQEDRIEQQGQDLDEIKRRLDDRARPPAPSWQPSPPMPSPPMGAPGAQAPLPGGVSLVVKIRGQGNLVRLFAATHPVMAGTFQLSRSGVGAAYYVPPGTRAIVELFAPDTRIAIAARLAGQVQIVSNGFRYMTLTD